MQDASRIYRSAAGGTTRCDRAWRLSRLWGAVAICAWACPSASAQAPVETVVRLYPSAVVNADAVLLSDVAEVRGESAQLVAAMELGAAPHIGRSGVIDLTQLQSMLGRRGVNLSTWVFRGASRCTVQRVGRAPVQASRPAASNRSTGLPDTAPVSGAVDTRPAGEPQGGTSFRPTADSPAGTNGQPSASAETASSCAPDLLEAKIREHLCQRMSDLGGTPIIRFSPGAARVLSLAGPTYAFRITERSDRPLGMVPLEVTVLENGEVRQTMPIIAEVSLRKMVVTAARSINRGEIIRPAHLAAEERTFHRVDEIGVSAKAMLIGQRTRRFIEDHTVISMSDVEPMPLILANDLVTVMVRRGALAIRSSAKAMSAGGLGDTVQLRNEISKEVFAAVVTGEKTAEVRDLVSRPAPVEPKVLSDAVAQTDAREVTP